MAKPQAGQRVQASVKCSKLRVLSGRDVMKILQTHGFHEVRPRGSHVVMQKTEGGLTTTVPIPDDKELRRGTLLSIIRQSQLPRTLFETG